MSNGLAKGGMGAYQWCHDCESWGVPGPLFDTLRYHGWDGLQCACGSKNVTHYEAVYERRDGEVTIPPAIPVSAVSVGGIEGTLQVHVEIGGAGGVTPYGMGPERIGWARVFKQALVLDQENVGVLSHISEALGIAKARVTSKT